MLNSHQKNIKKHTLFLNNIFGIDDFFGENLNEMAKIVQDDDNNISIIVSPDTKRNNRNNEYFKILNHKEYSKASKIARIKFRQPKYVLRHNNDGKKNWILNKDEKQLLINLLNKKNIYKESYWETAIIRYNLEAGLSEEKTLENTKDNLKYPDYLPIDLNLPDYTKL